MATYAFRRRSHSGAIPIYFTDRFDFIEFTLKSGIDHIDSMGVRSPRGDGTFTRVRAVAEDP